MSAAPEPPLLEALLNSWDRNNAIVVNLLGLVPADALEIRATESSPSVIGLFHHIHYVRLVFVLEDAPEYARALPEGEWRTERDRDRITAMLNESAMAVREAVRGRLESSRAMNMHYDHPILMLQHLIWHEGYHHGQIKLALKLAGRPINDSAASPGTWGIWMNKTNHLAPPNPVNR
ncbi:MAG: DinB family protein [Opitutus sp.]